MMISVVRKNLACLISKQNSLLCKSHVSFSYSLRFLSASGERILVKKCTRVYDVLVHKHHFSPQVASLAASALSRSRSPEIADSMLSFLKESGFNSTQLEKIVKSKPGILAAGSEDAIKFKIKIFQDLWLSPEDIAKIISSQVRILNLSEKNNIIPSLSLLKDLFGGSNHDVAELLRKSGLFLLADLEKTLVPNVAFLKSCGITMEQIRMLLYNYPRCSLVKPDSMRKYVEKAKELGVSQSSGLFIYAVRTFASLSDEVWELKLQAFQNLGFSDSDILTIFRKAPPVFTLSVEKIRKVIEFLLATGKFNMSDIVSNPTVLGCSIENRYKPRLRILGILESKNLMQRWPALMTIRSMTDAKFFEKFIGPYSNELGEEYITKSYGKER